MQRNVETFMKRGILLSDLTGKAGILVYYHRFHSIAVETN